MYGERDSLIVREAAPRSSLAKTTTTFPQLPRPREQATALPPRKCDQNDANMLKEVVESREESVFILNTV
jgi:hypothetical protein